MPSAPAVSRSVRHAVMVVIAVVVALLLCVVAWVHTSGWTTRAEAPQVSREQVGPVTDKTGSPAAAGYAVDTSRSAALVTATHRWGVVGYLLEVPVKATAPGGRLPELVHLSAAVVGGGVRHVCTEAGVPNPGTVQYPQRAVLLSCGDPFDTEHVSAVDVYQPDGWLK